MTTKSILWLLLLCLTATPPAWGETAFGWLRGTVTYKDGAPYAQRPVLVTAARSSVMLITRDDGVFAGLAPEGTVRVSASGVVVEVPVTAGETATTALVVPRTGVLLETDLPKVTRAMRAEILAVYWTNAAGVTADLPIAPRAGLAWFPQVAADAKEFAVQVWQVRGNLQSVTTYRWHFTTPAALRELSVKQGDAPPTVANLTLTDAQAHPLKGAGVDAVITWQPDGAPEPTRECRLAGYHTTAAGVLGIPLYWQPGHYTLALTVNEQPSAPVTVEYITAGVLAPRAVVVKPAAK